MQIRFRMAAIMVAVSVLYSVSSLAQPIDFDVLVDTDRNPVNGCSVTPSGGAPLGGFEHRIRASVDLASFEVVALEQSSCSGGSFGAPSAIPGYPVPYPLALNTGVGGSDAVELAVARSALGSAGLSELRLAFVTDNGTGSDVMATADGGGPILFGLPVQIPALSIWGLGALVFVLLALAWMAHRRLGRVGAAMAVMLVATAVWAMSFAPDGDLGDWGGLPPNATDPGGDATDGSAAIDLLAGFVALEGGALFFRMDVADTENEAPVAADDGFNTDEDTPLTVPAPGVLANDSDAEMDPITAVLDAGPANAQSFTLNPDGSFDYTPNADFNGADSFTYFANDGQANSVPATVTITVDPINDPPVAVDDIATTNEDTQVDIDVLANDSDVDGNLDPATVTVTAGPANGATVVNPATGIITYTKSGDFNGADGFTYEVCDDGAPLPALCSSATVSIDVDPVNDAPTFTASNPPAVDEDAGPQTVNGWVTAFDPGPGEGGQSVLAYIVSNVSTPGLFSAGPVVDVAGNLSYTPAADAFGSSTFDVAVRDDGGTANGGTDTSPTQTFTIIVNPVDDPPVAVADSATVTEDDPATTINVLANDTDIDGGPIGIVSVTQPANGAVVITNAGADLTYQPDPDFCNDGSPTDDFTYSLNGGSTATVAVTVTCVNDPPVVTFPTAGVNFDTNVGPVNLDPAATLTDIDSTRFNRVETTLNIGGICDPLDTLTIQDQGAGAGQIGFDGVTVTFEGTAISTAVQPWACNDPGTGDQDAFIVQLDTNADQPATEALVRALRFSSTSADSTARTAEVVVADDANATGSAAQNITLVQAPTANNDGPFNVPVGDPLNLPAGTLFNDNGSGADDRGLPLADIASFGGGDLGGSVTTNTAGASVALAGGTLQVNADGSLSLTGTSVAGAVTFGYRLTNAAGSDDASVTIIIEQAPTANDDTVAPASNPGDPFHTALDTPLSPADGSTEDLDANDDLGGPAATISSFGAIQTNDGAGAFTAPAGTVTTNPQGTAVTPLPNYPDGSLVVNSNGTYTFTPPSDYAGLFAFGYRLSNSAGTSDATVTLAVGNRAACSVDAYTGTANIDFEVNAAGGILANDTGSSISVSQSMGSAANVGSPTATTNGGFVTLNADGSFDYSPPAGVTGANADSFTYAIANGFGEVTTNCTANITLNTDGGSVPWFIDRGAAGANVGTFADPFTSIAAFNAVNNGVGNNPADGDIVYVFADLPGFYNEADGLNLLNGQEVYGGTVQFNTVFAASGSTSAAYNSFAATTEGGRTEIRTTGDDAFDIASNNTIQGFTVDSTAGYAFADSGGNIGTTTISDVSTFNGGGVFNLQNGGTINATLDRMSASVSTAGQAAIALNGIAGSITDTTPGGIIHSGNGNVFDIRNSSVSVTVSSPVTKTTGTGTAILLNNADGTITLSGALDISSGTAGVNVVNGSDGSLNITNAGSSIEGIQGIPFRVNNSSMAIDYDGDITHTAPADLSQRMIELINATGFMNFNGAYIAGDNANFPVQLHTAEGLYMEATGTANPVTINYIDLTSGSTSALKGLTSGGIVINRVRMSCYGDLIAGSDTHCIDFSDVTSGGVVVEFADVRLQNAGDFGGAISLVNTPGTWTIQEFLTLNGRGEDIVFGNNFGTLNIGTVTPGSVTAFDIAGNGTAAFNLTNGEANIQAQSVSVFSAPFGIRLVNTTGAGFTVTGDGSTAGSGGVLQDITGDAVVLNNTGGPVSLSYMTIQDIGNMSVIDSEHDAIHGQNVNGGLVLDNMIIRRISDMAVHGAAFPNGDGDTVWNGLTITNSTIQDTNRYHVAGAGDTSDEGSVRIRGLRGTALIDGNTFQDGAEHLDLFATAGTLDLTVTGNDFFESYKEFTSGGIASVGKMCVDLTVQGTADATVVIGDLVDAALGNNFRNCRIASVRIGNDSAATGTVTSTVANNTFLVTDHSSGIGGDFDFPMGGVNYSTRGAMTAVFDGRISNNTFTDVTNAAGGVGNVTLDMDQGVIQVLVDGNTFHAPGNAAWFVRADGTSSFDLLFDNNTYQRDAFPCTTDPSCGGGYFGPGLFNRTVAQNGAVLDVTYRNEDFAQHDTAFDPGNTVEVQVPNVGGGGTVCASFTGNSSPHGYALEESAGDLNLFNGLSAVTGTCPTANCATVLGDNSNTGGGGNPLADPPTVSVFGTIDIVSSACNLPSGGIF